MQDLDSAVGKLDDILMTLYVIIAILIIAVALVIYNPFDDLCLACSSFFFSFRKLS